MKKLILKEHILTVAMLLGAAVTILSAGFVSFAEDCEALPERLFRLHILANSNSAEDQELKYALRDYLLDEFTEIFEGCENAEQARAAAEESLADITEKAQKFVADKGYDYTVSASVENIFFTTRQYGAVTVPAGDYNALRILIGSGGGKNWWCVMFPPLCLPAAEGTIETSDDMDFMFSAKLEVGKNADSFSTAESLKTESGEDVEIRFAVFEWLKGFWE